MAEMNPYRVLGVDVHASGRDIRRAYHMLALRFHPDGGGGDETSERFVEIHEAYRLLSDPAARADYDRAHQEYAARRHEHQFAPPLAVTAVAVEPPVAIDVLDLAGRGFVHEGVGHGVHEALHYELLLSPREAARGGRFRFAIPVRRRGSFLVEERALEVIVPPGVHDGARAELALPEAGIAGSFVDVTVRIE